MTRRRGLALLSAIVAVVVVVSTAIFVAVLRAGSGPHDPLAGGRGPQDNAAPASSGTWVSTWTGAAAGGEPGTAATGLAGRTLRNVVHTSAGGNAARVTFSNLYGKGPLHITHASVAVAAAPDSAAAVPETMRRLTFGGGSTTAVIAAGSQMVSDSVRIRVPRDQDLLVSSYAARAQGPVTYHPHARQVSFGAHGDVTSRSDAAPFRERVTHWRYVTAVDVLSTEAHGTVVVLGDSLTDGISSTLNANRRWPDVLSGRLHSESTAPRYSIVNQGISGNRILSDGLGRPAVNPSGLSRYERDVLNRPGLRAVVVLLGVNDILRTPHETDSARIVQGLRQMTERAHAKGVRVIGATLMPFGGHRGYLDELERVRQDVNAEIRSGTVFDAYADFDSALRDPYAPKRLRPMYDSGDHLHMSDLGYRRMAEVFPVDELRGSVPGQA